MCVFKEQENYDSPLAASEEGLKISSMTNRKILDTSICAELIAITIAINSSLWLGWYAVVIQK